MTKKRFIIGVLIMLIISIAYVVKVFGIGGSVNRVRLSYYRYGIEINDHEIDEGDYVDIDAGSFLITSIERTPGGTEPYEFCVLSELNSYYECNTSSSTWWVNYWAGSHPEDNCYLWGASVDDDIVNFHTCGAGWFNITSPSEAQTVNRGETVPITWNTDTHSGSSCSSVNIYLCQENGTDDDLTVPVVRTIELGTSNDGSYQWDIGCDDDLDDNYRIMVVCGSATGYSEIFEIIGDCCPDLTVESFDVTYEEISDNDGIIESSDQFRISCTFTIRNIGGVATSSSWYKIMKKDWDGCTSWTGAEDCDQGSVSAIAPGGFRTFSEIIDQVPRGCYEYWIVIDPDDEIAECDESNNSNSACDESVGTENKSWSAIKTLCK